MALEDNTKKDLAQMVRDLQAKLKELKPVESALTSQLEDLHSNAAGLIKDSKGIYSIVKIKYDIEKNAAAIEKVESCETPDLALAQFQLNKFVVETIVRKARGGKFDL